MEEVPPSVSLFNVVILLESSEKSVRSGEVKYQVGSLRDMEGGPSRRIEYESALTRHVERKMIADGELMLYWE